MLTFPTLLEAGAAVAVMSEVCDGDCGWGGYASGTRAAFLARAAVPPDKLVALRQCHGGDIVAVEPADAGRGAGDRDGALADADGLMTRHRGIPLGINVADCVPVYLVAPEAIALVHAGREGTARGITGGAVRQLSRRYGVAPASISALIGPSAGPCCYQVLGRSTGSVGGKRAGGPGRPPWISGRRTGGNCLTRM